MEYAMQLPDVDNEIVDVAKKVTYNVKAYRKLERHELLTAIRFYLSQRKRKPAKNSRVTIVTIIGFND